jgi:large subunit ribosomal protein L25
MATDNKTYELSVEAREERGKVARKMRHHGQVPGVVYGHNVDSESIAVSRRDLEQVYLRAGSNNLVDLKIGGGQARKVFIYKVQRDPVTHSVRHVDFLAVNLREEITASVPVVLVGESPAVANGEGLLMQALDSVQVRSLPLDLPSLIEVDISELVAVGDGIHVSAIAVPENVALITSEEELIARVTDLPAEEVVEVEEAEAAEEAEGEVEGEETRAEANAEGGNNEKLPEETA